MTRIPGIRRSLPATLTPDRALDRLAALPGRVLLETGGGDGRTLLSAAPRGELKWDGEICWVRSGRSWRPLAKGTDPLDLLSVALLEWERGMGQARRDAPFAGAWIGYFGYETAGLLERLPPPPPADAWDLPPLWFGAFDWVVIWEDGGPPVLHATQLPDMDGLTGSTTGGGGMTERLKPILRLLEVGGPKRGRSLGGGGWRLDEEEPAESGTPDGMVVRPGEELESSLGKGGYMRGIERIREYIRAGDIFQANLTHRIQTRWTGSGVDLYRRLREASPAPYAGYLDTGEGEVASVSPEAFLSLEGRKVVTRPIKGTAPRGGSEAQDQELARALEASMKDRAENVMIVDLLRNDLSRVCEPGSVQVPALCALESHPTVHHLVSTVEGLLSPGVGPLDLLRATLPGGSITGAPKIRAMEIIRELEPVPRGVYTGALGVLEPGGRMNLSIAIRTATLRDGVARFGVGGGITLASDPQGEWQESLDKAQPFLSALGIPRVPDDGTGLMEGTGGGRNGERGS